MSREQGLSPQTIATRCRAIEPFLDRLRLPQQSLAEVVLTQIDEALVQHVRAGGCSRRTVATLACTLRAFFRYAQSRGWCRHGLAEGIKAPRLFPLETLPTGPSWDQVRRLLTLTQTERVTDIRDRAILMLLAVYGLRSEEVVRLCLEDFDWQRETLSVFRTKTRRSQSFPLSRPVGDAVLRYLEKGRPRSTFRQVFLRRHAAIRPLSANALWPIVGRRLRTLGVSLRHCGPHALRHACATHLLSEGLSLKEIGDYLGHQHADATRLYAKVDLIGLRQVGDFDMGGLL
jgi:integrase/recombinase XerD